MAEGKFCANCAHLIGVRTQDEFHVGWQCGHENNVQAKFINPVTGLEQKTYKMLNCLEVRHVETACGPTGSWWTEYQRPVHAPSGASNKGDALLDSLLT